MRQSKEHHNQESQLATDHLVLTRLFVPKLLAELLATMVKQMGSRWEYGREGEREEW